MLPFCSLPLTEGYNFVRYLSSSPPPPETIGSLVILVPTACRAAVAGQLLVAGCLQRHSSTPAVGGSSLSPHLRCLSCQGCLLLFGLWLMVD